MVCGASGGKKAIAAGDSFSDLAEGFAGARLAVKFNCLASTAITAFGLEAPTRSFVVRCANVSKRRKAVIAASPGFDPFRWFAEQSGLQLIGSKPPSDRLARTKLDGSINRGLMPEFGGLSGAQPIRRWLGWHGGGVAQYEQPFDVVNDIGQADLGRCDKRRAGFSQTASVRKDIVRWMTLPSGV
jgi:hypothetical protein